MKKFNNKRRGTFFDKILMKVPTTNTFDLSYGNKLTFNMGELVPILSQEVLPGDSFKITQEHILKMAPLATPVFHRCKVNVHYFFVPNRLLWENFEKFQAYDNLNEVPVHPYISPVTADGANVDICSLADYMGVPTGNYDLAEADHPIFKLNPLSMAAYFKTFDDYYRDQNLVSEKWRPLTDGDNTLNQMFGAGINGETPFTKGPLLRAWEKDYFTSCLPFAQKGQEVVLPLGTSAPIEFDTTVDPQNDGAEMYGSASLTPLGNAGDVKYGVAPGGSELGMMVDPAGTDPEGAIPNNAPWLKANLEEATAASINDLRVAVRLQEFFERNARLGTRYIEQMLGKFGVRISDERAHRSEYIGGTHAPVMFSEVLQTSQTDTTPLAQQGGHGTSVNSQFAVNHYCEEHGLIIGIMSVMPDTGYMQGIHRKFMKNDILDYYDPMFANLGEQAVLNAELYANTNELATGTFGYQSRYAELKYNSSEVHGTFRTTEADWHMDRIFPSLPSLAEVFISCDATHRVFADTDEDTKKMWCYVWHNIKAQRKIPFFSTPTFNSPING